MSSSDKTVVASTADDWRAWLAANCRTAEEVWLVLRHRDSGAPGLRYHEAVEQALCFGWIDGLHRKRDADSSQLRFTPRTARSRWSQLNRQRAARMIELGQMTEHGRAAINRAKAAGTWQVLPDEQLGDTGDAASGSPGHGQRPDRPARMSSVARSRPSRSRTTSTRSQNSA